MDYEIPGSCESNEYIVAFTEFLSNTFGKHASELFGIMDKICRACREERGINEIFGMLIEEGFAPQSQKSTGDIRSMKCAISVMIQMQSAVTYNLILFYYE